MLVALVVVIIEAEFVYSSVGLPLSILPLDSLRGCATLILRLHFTCSI